ncbi:hypothetical protein TNCT_17151, partial [Trichonephila clavata]
FSKGYLTLIPPNHTGADPQSSKTSNLGLDIIHKGIRSNLVSLTTLLFPFLFKRSISIVRRRNVNIFYYKEQTLTCVEVGHKKRPSGQQHKSRECRLVLLPD